MAKPSAALPARKRLLWIDIAKGIGILWVVYFHFVTNYLDADINPNMPSVGSGHFWKSVAAEHGWDSVASAVHTLARGLGWGISLIGFHAVGLFVLLGGWALAQTTWRKSEKGPIAWGSWYGQRLVRLYPMYWCAHLLFLALPFTWLEPIDGRFLVSLTGLRWINIEENFMYGNAAWWYFAMLLELYALFPLLFVAMRRLGLLAFLSLCLAVGFAARYLLLVTLQANGFWLLGGNCLSRLPEFAVGMVLGIWHLKDQAKVERIVLGVPAILAGCGMYYGVSLVSGGAVPYVFSDLYTGLGCSLLVLGASGLVQQSDFWAKWIGRVGTYSFGIYLIHQPLVTWLGQRIKTVGTLEFAAISAAVLLGFSVVGIGLETLVNRLTDRVLSKPAPTGS
jgi:peptidoglycan/LPS O-acetylase OafA/YrhL